MTAEFAVAAIGRWWAVGSDLYPKATSLLICADGGGSNGYRSRIFKTEPAALASRTGPQITVRHLPPGTSKWNKIATESLEPANADDHQPPPVNFPYARRAFRGQFS